MTSCQSSLGFGNLSLWSKNSLLLVKYSSSNICGPNNPRWKIVACITFQIATFSEAGEEKTYSIPIFVSCPNQFTGHEHTQERFLKAGARNINASAGNFVRGFGIRGRMKLRGMSGNKDWRSLYHKTSLARRARSHATCITRVVSTNQNCASLRDFGLRSSSVEFVSTPWA